jgi:hypothetical protein
MPKTVAVGLGSGLNGREAGRQAAQQALEQMGTTARPALVIALVSQEYEMSEALNGINSYLGSAPVWGFSTPRTMSSTGDQPRSVMVAVISGSDYRAQVHWLPGYSQDTTRVFNQLSTALENETFSLQGLLLAADGINGDMELGCNRLSKLNLPVAGCLAAGGYQLGKTYQIGGAQSGTGALSVLALGGRLRLATGSGHGWIKTGLFFKVTRSRGIWLQALDGQPPAEVFARVFGRTAREWAFPPLNELVRLYPLGVESEAFPEGLSIRSPLLVEVDGGFRMNSAIPEGRNVYLMTADLETCKQAAISAAQQAKQAMGAARPLLACVMVDVGWRYLFETHPGLLMRNIQTILGDIPVIGAYTLGQVARSKPEDPLRLYNQNILIAILAEE